MSDRSKRLCASDVPRKPLSTWAHGAIRADNNPDDRRASQNPPFAPQGEIAPSAGTDPADRNNRPRQNKSGRYPLAVVKSRFVFRMSLDCSLPAEQQEPSLGPRNTSEKERRTPLDTRQATPRV